MPCWSRSRTVFPPFPWAVFRVDPSTATPDGRTGILCRRNQPSENRWKMARAKTKSRGNTQAERKQNLPPNSGGYLERSPVRMKRPALSPPLDSLPAKPLTGQALASRGRPADKRGSSSLQSRLLKHKSVCPSATVDLLDCGDLFPVPPQDRCHEKSYTLEQRFGHSGARIVMSSSDAWEDLRRSRPSVGLVPTRRGV